MFYYKKINFCLFNSFADYSCRILFLQRVTIITYNQQRLLLTEMWPFKSQPTPNQHTKMLRGSFVNYLIMSVSVESLKIIL